MIYKALIISILLLLNCESMARAVLDLNNFDLDGKNIGLNTYWYEDRSNKLDIDIVSKENFQDKFIPSDKRIINLGFSGSTLWIRFKILNPLPIQKTLHFHEPWSLKSIVSLYSKGKKIGSLTPGMDLSSRIITFNIEPNTENTFFVKLKSSSSMLTSQFTFWTNFAQLKEYLADEKGKTKVLFAIFAMAIFFNLMFLIAYRTRIYVYYMFYIIFVIFCGVLVLSFWGDNIVDELCLLFFVATFAHVFAALFAVEFLKTKSHYKWSHRILMVQIKSFIGIFTLQFISNFFTEWGSINAHLNNLAVLVYASATLLVFSTSLYASITSRRIFIHMFTLAYGALMSASTIQYISWLGIIDYLGERFIFYGVAAENILMLGALSYRIWETEKERIVAHSKVKEQLTALKKLDSIKDEFLANTSHELRTPLNGILGIADSLIEGANGILDKKTQSDLSLISLSANRLNNLVNDILDFSKLKKKDISLQLKSINLHDLIKVVVDISSYGLKKNLKIKNNVIRHFPNIVADENRVYQILHNVIGNAVKFTDQGEVIISGNFTEETVVISVKDSGIGIAKDKFNSIFSSFEQGDGTTQRNHGGTGLGLSISKKLVELHKGRIWLTSELGKGSIFYLEFPRNLDSLLNQVVIHEPKTDIQFRRVESYEIDEESANDLSEIDGQITVLIVDDEPVNLQALRNQLSLQSFNIWQASNGQKAIDIINEKGKPDLILLDVMMPRMSGYEVTKEVRKTYNSSQLPIILLTAKNRIKDILTGFKMGANDYITKPIVKSEMLARINTHIELSELNFTLERKIEERTRQLKDKNRDIEAILANISQGIFTINNKLEIEAQYSNHLEKIFEQDSLSGENVISLIFNKTPLSREEINTIRASLELGDSAINFQLNKHLLPTQVSCSINHKEKLLDLSWDKMEGEHQQIDKIMVSVKDVTRLKKLQRSIDQKNSEMAIISEILSSGIEQFKIFMAGSEDLLEEGKNKNELRYIDILARNLHTIKGNAKSLGYKELASQIHETEHYFHRVIKKESTFTMKESSQQLEKAESILEHYKNILSKYVGNSSSVSSSYNEFVKFLEDEIAKEKDSEYNKKLSATIRDAVHKFESFGASLLEVLSPLLNSIPKLCTELSKNEAEVSIDGGELKIPPPLQNLLLNIMTHLLRNALYHGIEDNQIRVKKGKPANGKVFIMASLKNSKLNISVEDDGQGLNMRYLRDIATKKGLDLQNTSDHELASMIFNSGLSTSEDINDISGRGVGLDAVKSFIEESGGCIKLEFKDDEERDGYKAIRFRISLPC